MKGHPDYTVHLWPLISPELEHLQGIWLPYLGTSSNPSEAEQLLWLGPKFQLVEIKPQSQKVVPLPPNQLSNLRAAAAAAAVTAITHSPPPRKSNRKSIIRSIRICSRRRRSSENISNIPPPIHSITNCAPFRISFIGRPSPHFSIPSAPPPAQRFFVDCHHQHRRGASSVADDGGGFFGNLFERSNWISQKVILLLITVNVILVKIRQRSGLEGPRIDTLN